MTLGHNLCLADGRAECSSATIRPASFDPFNNSSRPSRPIVASLPGDVFVSLKRRGNDGSCIFIGAAPVLRFIQDIPFNVRRLARLIGGTSEVDPLQDQLGDVTQWPPCISKTLVLHPSMMEKTDAKIFTADPKVPRLFTGFAGNV